MPPGAKSFDPIRGYVFSFCFGIVLEVKTDLFKKFMKI